MSPRPSVSRLPVPSDGGVDLAAIGAAFCISGISALIYQVAWQRILALHSGVGIYSVALIVAAFLAGIGLGSYLGGVVTPRTPPRAALRAFALLELATGGFAAVSCFLYYDLLYLRFPSLYSNLALAGVCHFIALLLPTALMGMSLPYLVRATVRDPRTASRTVGFLYGLNVLGAGVGALITPWVLIRLFGVQGAIYIGALGNGLVGLVALALVTRQRVAEAPPPELAVGLEAAGFEPAGRYPFGLWLTLYALSGFVALSLELLWFRVIDVAVKSTAFTFGTVLAVYLLGLGAGSLIGGPIAVVVKRPLRAFLMCQIALLLYAGLAVMLLVRLPADLPWYGGLVDYWGRADEFALGRVWEWRQLLTLYLFLPVALYGPSTILMGVSFGLLQRGVQDDRQSSGRKVGVLQAGNIAGNVMGSLVCGLLLLNLLGTMGALRVIIATGLVFVAVAVRYYGMLPRFLAPGAGLIGLLLFLPSNDALWARLHGAGDGRPVFEEDATGVIGIVPGADHLRFSINGIGQSWLPFASLAPIHGLLGLLPAVVHPAPRDVAVIGLGSGETAWAAACRPETTSVRVFEIAAPQQRALARVSGQGNLPALGRFLSDPRIDIVTADGRNRLALDERRYDLIEADALRPGSAYAGNLYSLEFFRLCAQRLKPGGLMCIWSPTPRVHRTFTEAFPHVLETWGGTVLIGSNEPIDVDVEAVLGRLATPEVTDYLGADLAAEAVYAVTALRPATATHADLAPNLDLFPRDEFLSP